MKNFWKYFGFSALGLFVVLYLAFLFILPNVIHLENYTQVANDFLKKTRMTMNKHEFFMN